VVGDHPEQWSEGLDVVRLSRRQHEPERPTVSVAAGMEFGGEAAARPKLPSKDSLESTREPQVKL